MLVSEMKNLVGLRLAGNFLKIMTQKFCFRGRFDKTSTDL